MRQHRVWYGALNPTHLDLSRAPYARCGVNGTFVSHLDLSRAPYALYDVKYIDLVSLGAFVPRNFLFFHHVLRYGTFVSHLDLVVRPMFCLV